jgi:hypothetical protein
MSAIYKLRPMNSSLRHHLVAVLRAVGTALVVPILLFEEWGWTPLASLAAQLGRLPVWARLERWIGSLPPTSALVVFAVPVIALFPLKLMALVLFGSGHFASGCALLIGAKIAGTAVVARLFQLTLPALMQFPLFARWYPAWKAWKDGVLASVRASAPWHAAMTARAGARRYWGLLMRGAG